jgi:hypothetical protein
MTEGHVNRHSKVVEAQKKRLKATFDFAIETANDV